MFDSFLDARENTSAWHLALDFTGASLNFEAQQKGLRPNRLWLLGKNQNYSGLGYREGLDPNRVQSQTSSPAANPSNQLWFRFCIPKSSPDCVILRDERMPGNSKPSNEQKLEPNGRTRDPESH